MTRREKLEELRGVDVYDDRTQRVLDGEEACPRYALRTTEGSHDDNPNLTVHDDLASVAKQIREELDEYPSWGPESVVDLDSGEELRYEIETTVAFVGGPTVTAEAFPVYPDGKSGDQQAGASGAGIATVLAELGRRIEATRTAGFYPNAEAIEITLTIDPTNPTEEAR